MCNGQLLSISQNDALFALLGTTYGGTGTTTFGLPNLQSRVPDPSRAGIGAFTVPDRRLRWCRERDAHGVQTAAHTHLVYADGDVPATIRRVQAEMP